ncbi:hypothetical protein KM043_003618 [Ampulex compressa]|nr:hypothetical protein KM043_003618 [Ampulex compressa]
MKESGTGRSIEKFLAPARLLQYCPARSSWMTLRRWGFKGRQGLCLFARSFEARGASLHDKRHEARIDELRGSAASTRISLEILLLANSGTSFLDEGNVEYETREPPCWCIKRVSVYFD